jgi:hypothetical protein
VVAGAPPGQTTDAPWGTTTVAGGQEQPQAANTKPQIRSKGHERMVILSKETLRR